MAQNEIEIILARNLAEYMALPIFIVNPDGNLLYYNEPAEAILGVRYNETGAMPASEWSTMFHPLDRHGEPLEAVSLPLMIALLQRNPAHSTFFIRSLDGVLREIEVTAFPLIGPGERFLGAVAIFWERAA